MLQALIIKTQFLQGQNWDFSLKNKGNQNWTCGLVRGYFSSSSSAPSLSSCFLSPFLFLSLSLLLSPLLSSDEHPLPLAFRHALHHWHWEASKWGRLRSRIQTVGNVPKWLRMRRMSHELLSHFSASSSGFLDRSQQFWTPCELLSKLTPRLLSFVARKIDTFFLQTEL